MINNPIGEGRCDHREECDVQPFDERMKGVGGKGTIWGNDRFLYFLKRVGNYGVIITIIGQLLHIANWEL